jgi:hypothetical protein
MERMSNKRNRDDFEKTAEKTKIVIKEKKEVDVKKPQVETCWYFKILQEEPSREFFGSD